MTDKQKAKVRACKTPEELLQLANKEGCKISLDDLDAASGGWEYKPPYPTFGDIHIG